MANAFTSALWQQAAHTTYQLISYLLNKSLAIQKIKPNAYQWKFSGEKKSGECTISKMSKQEE